MYAGIHTTGGEYIYIKLTYRATVGLRCNRCERGFITATRGMGGDWMRNEATPLLTHFLSYCQWPCKYFKILFTSVDIQSTFFISLAYKYTFETIFDHILSLGLKKVKLRRVIKKTDILRSAPLAMTVSKCENVDPFFHWILILWYSKHISSHGKGSQKCIFHAHLWLSNWEPASCKWSSKKLPLSCVKSVSEHKC